MKYALEGIRVVDIGQMLAGPAAAVYLADQGADVIKVEPLWGDETRRLMSQSPLRGLSRYYFPINRNKRGIAVDITTDEGKDIIRRLVGKADVFIHNYSVEVMRRLGMSYEDFVPINKRLIYVECGGYGNRGPYAACGAYDYAAQALSGLLSLRSLPDGTPTGGGITIADTATPMLAAYGVALALIARHETGLGQKVETSLLAGAMAMQLTDLAKGVDETSVERYTSQALYSPYRCGDGKWLVILVISDRQWASLCRLLELEHVASEATWETQLDRAQSSQELYELISGILSTRPRDEWLRQFRESDIVAAPILTRDEVYDEEQLLVNELIVEVDQPPVGRIRTVGIPVKLSSLPGRIRMSAPQLGEHTNEILSEIGYSEGRIQELRRKKVIS